MIVLFNDLGLEGPYTGQMKAVLHRMAPGVPVIDLLADAPACNPRAAAYLLAALAAWFPAGSIFLAVVDPGVGGTRAPLVLEADDRLYVGPDNGLFELLIRRSGGVRAFAIAWRPAEMSMSFHGRDLFAPVAARLAAASLAPDDLRPIDPTRQHDWPDDLPEIVYVDRFGNAMTGLRASVLAPDARLRIAGRDLRRARTFSDLPTGTAFWYENSSGLAEIAVNSGRADAALGLAIGSAVAITP